MPQTQNYKNHVRLHAPFHFVLTPILLVHLIYSIVRLVQEPSLDRIDMLLIAIALIILQFLARIYPLKVQDRIIRLEEQLRYERVLPADLAAQAANLPLNQIIALRFASNAELPTLVEQALNGEFKKGNDIKGAIKNWRGDYSRV